MEKLRRTIQVSFIVTLLLVPVVGIAGSLDPPPSAVDASGNPVPTEMAAPSWSQKLQCDTGACPRFEIVLDGAAVLDKETGLVWQRVLDNGSRVPWVYAFGACQQLRLGGRAGWHLPSIEQLVSLMETNYETNYYAINLPVGHPFQNFGGPYWTATSNSTTTVIVWHWGFYFMSWDKSDNLPVICVRGGQTYDAY